MSRRDGKRSQHWKAGSNERNDSNQRRNRRRRRHDNDYDRHHKNHRLPYDSDSSSVDDGRAPIYAAGDKRKRHESRRVREEKRSRYSSDEAERRRTSPQYLKQSNRKASKKKIFLDASVLREPVEHAFSFKQPTVISPGVFRIEEVPYVSKNTVRRLRIREAATTVKQKTDYYIQLVNLEDERVKGMPKTNANFLGHFDNLQSKLKIIKEGLRQCGKKNIDLKLLKIDAFTAFKGYNSPAVRKTWNELLKAFPNDLKMWRRRLIYFRNHCDVFNASSYIKEYVIPCLRFFCDILHQSTNHKQEGTEDFIIDAIVGAVSLYIEMGLTYKAIGILQALIEFHFLVPKDVEEFNFGKKLEAFEYYWMTPIPKVGHSGSLGWNRVTSNISYTKYDFPSNVIITAKVEEQKRNAMARNVYYNDIDYCRNNKNESSCEVWSKIEQHRTSSFCEPTYNSSSNPLLFKNYNSFKDIRPFLSLKLPNEIILKIVFKILMKFGAVLPDMKDYSQESIFQTCKLYNRDFDEKYHGIEKFIDNVLCHISGVDEELYLYAAVARLMTCKSFVLNKYRTYEEAKCQFMNDADYIIKTCVRPPNSHEIIILKSYVAQLQREIFQHFSYDILMAIPNPEDRNAVPNIFDPKLPLPHLLATLRYCVMLCRDLPHYDPDFKEPFFLTKLKFLMKLSLPNEKDIDCFSKEVQQKAIKQWKDAKLHETNFNLPPGSRWIGNINIFALELISMFSYELEDNELMKFEAFKSCYSFNILKDNEDVTEICFKTWSYHLDYYYQEKEKFMSELKRFIEIFPRNVYLTMLYIANLRHNEMETRHFFLMNPPEDDVVKTLRCVVQIAAEYENVIKNSINQKSKYKYLNEILKNAAIICSNNIIPESFLWRYCLFFLKHTNNTVFDDMYESARNYCCPWSKNLLTFAASLSTSSGFVKDIEKHAKKVGIELMTSVDEIKEMI